MKALLALALASSLLANGVLWYQLQSATGSTDAEAGSLAATALTAQDGASAASGQPEQEHRLSAPVLSVSLSWTSLPRDDLAALTARLRRLGVPSAAIRAILKTELARVYQPRLLALQARQTPPRYWRQYRESPGPEEAALRAEIRALNREQTNALDQLLGENDTGRDEQNIAYLKLRHGDLSESKLASVQAIEADYFDLERQVRGQGQGLLLKEDRDLLEYLDEQKRTDLLAILTPDEYEQREMRTSSTAMLMRTHLVGMEPTEEEFRTIFRLQKPYDESYQMGGRPNTPEGRAEAQAAERALVAAVKAALGEERGAEYERSRDYNYGRHHLFVREQGLSRETAVKLWMRQKDTMQRYQQIGADRAVPASERLERQHALIEAATTAIATDVGASNVEAYNRVAGGWLRGLQQVVARNQKAAAPPSSP